MGGGAPSIDAEGDVYVADGNGNAYPPSDPYDDSDSVLELSPTMKLLGAFAPSYFRTDNSHDRDLGSGAPQLLDSGLLLQIGKTHIGYLLTQGALGNGPATTDPPQFTVCPSGQDNGGAAIISQTSTTAVLAIPCDGGLEEATVTSTPSPSGTTGWISSESTAPPIYAAGALEAIEPSESGSQLVVIDPSTGDLLLSAKIGPARNHFETPSAGDGILVAAGSAKVEAFRPTTK